MKSLKVFACLSLVLLPILALPGCAGYQLGAVKPSAFAEIESLAIPTFKNETLEPRSSVLITNAVIKRFHEDGTYRLTTTAEADATLEGTFKEIIRRQLRGSRTDQLRTRELEVVIVVDYVLRDNRSGEILEEGSLRGTTDTYIDPNFQLSERQALPLAADDLAGQLTSRLSEGW